MHIASDQYKINETTKDTKQTDINAVKTFILYTV